jgi:hypothetical protein
LLRARGASSAFHPHGAQKVLDCGTGFFALLRLSPDGNQRVLCLQNVSDQTQRVAVDLEGISGSLSARFTDLLNNEPINDPLHGTLEMKPYQTLWLRITE